MFETGLGHPAHPGLNLSKSVVSHSVHKIYQGPVSCRRMPIKFCSSGKDLVVVVKIVIKSQDEKYR